MTVHFASPYRTDKNLGRAYNEFVRLLPEEDWVCLMDYDCMLLTPDAGQIIHEYVCRNRTVGVLTCWTNRISVKSTAQLKPELFHETDISIHIKVAENQKQMLYRTTEINQDISGMLMVISKATWNEFKFTEDGKCLGVDTEYNRRLRVSGKQVLRMEGLYVWHTYRLLSGIHSKQHLR